MTTIKLQFVAQRNLGSALIGYYSAGNLSHVDAVIDDEGSLLGARSNYKAGVQIRPPDYALFSRRLIAELPCTPTQYDGWRSFLRGEIGKPYDRRAILAFAFNRDWRRPDSWICSELQARALEVAGIVPPLYLACNKITPVALALVVSALSSAHLYSA